MQQKGASSGDASFRYQATLRAKLPTLSSSTPSALFGKTRSQREDSATPRSPCSRPLSRCAFTKCSPRRVVVTRGSPWMTPRKPPYGTWSPPYCLGGGSRESPTSWKITRTTVPSSVRPRYAIHRSLPRHPKRIQRGCTVWGSCLYPSSRESVVLTICVHHLTYSILPLALPPLDDVLDGQRGAAAHPHHRRMTRNSCKA